MVRSLLAVALAYALLLQGAFLSAQAGSGLAMAAAVPTGVLTLCSGREIPGNPLPDAFAHHASAKSSCCAWNIPVGLDPFVPPSSPALALSYRSKSETPPAAAVAPPGEPRFRTVGAQGSRAPPILAS